MPNARMTEPLPEMCHKIRHAAVSFGWQRKELLRVIGNDQSAALRIIGEMSQCMADVLEALSIYCARVNDEVDFG